MVTRYVVQVLTLNRGDMWFSENNPCLLDFRLPYAKRFRTSIEAHTCIAMRLKNRNCHVIAIDA
jgi:hypothetical protein